jgi:hypothetical protein
LRYALYTAFSIFDQYIHLFFVAGLPLPLPISNIWRLSSPSGAPPHRR